MNDGTGDIFTLDDVAAYLKIGKRTIYRLAAAKKIPAFKVGGSWRFSRADIDRWIKQQSMEGLDAGREEILHFVNAARGLHVLVRRSAADSRFVNADNVGYLRHCERLQVRYALVQEILLHSHDLGRDLEERLLSLLDALDHEHA